MLQDQSKLVYIFFVKSFNLVKFMNFFSIKGQFGFSDYIYAQLLILTRTHVTSKPGRNRYWSPNTNDWNTAVLDWC